MVCENQTHFRNRMMLTWRRKIDKDKQRLNFMVRPRKTNSVQERKIWTTAFNFCPDPEPWERSIHKMVTVVERKGLNTFRWDKLHIRDLRSFITDPKTYSDVEFFRKQNKG